MIGGMPFLHSHKQPLATSAHLALSQQLHLDRCPVLSQVHRFCIDRQRGPERRRSTQLNAVGCCDSAGWLVQPGSIHERNGGGPVPVAIQQRTNDTTVDHARERLVMRLRGIGHGQPVRCSM